jgi:hypothetical protein
MERTCTALGEFCCAVQENLPEFLRLVVDRLEGKLPRDAGWHYHAIKAAEREAMSRARNQLPTFSEFFAVFKEQNPKLFEPTPNRPDGIAPSERSLRRSLKRLFISIRDDKRGRPRKK